MEASSRTAVASLILASLLVGVGLLLGAAPAAGRGTEGVEAKPSLRPPASLRRAEELHAWGHKKIGKEWERFEERVEKEVKRTVGRTRAELGRLQQRLEKNRLTGVLLQAALATFLGPQGLMLANTIGTLEALAASEGRRANLLSSGLGVLPLGAGTPGGNALLELAAQLPQLRTPEGQAQFIGNKLGERAGVHVYAIERLAGPSGRAEFLRTVQDSVERSNLGMVFGALDRLDAISPGLQGQNPQMRIQTLASVIGSPQVIQAVSDARSRSERRSNEDYASALGALNRNVVPKLTGLPYGRAKALLADVGLSHTTFPRFTTRADLKDVVESQRPDPNTPAQDNTHVVLFVYLVEAPTPPPVQVTVPDLINEPLENARKILQARELGAFVAKYVNTRDYSKHDRVESQTPKAGARVARGSPVELWVNRFLATRPKAEVVVPNVVGQPGEAALRHLGEVGLEGRGVGTVETRDPSQVGRVVSQKPPGGARVNRGSLVQLRTFRLATPPPAAEVLVPKLSNLPLLAALESLRRAGLRPGTVGFTPTANAALDLRVQFQSPQAGAPLKRGSMVNLSVLTGVTSPPPVQALVPNLSNRPLAGALESLRKAGLRPGSVMFTAVTNAALDLRVSSQSPQAGSGRAGGSMVKLNAWWHAP